MASMGWIGLGMTSISGRGLSKLSGNNSLAAIAAKAKKDAAKAAKQKNFKLSFEEVQNIRALDEAGKKRMDIFKEHVEGKMSYLGMISILNHITRVWE